MILVTVWKMAVKMLIPWILLVCGCMRSVAALKNMQIDFEWKYIDYDYSSEEAREKAISSDEYDRSNLYAVDVDMDRGYKEYLYRYSAVDRSLQQVVADRQWQFDLNSDTLVKSIPLPNKVTHDPLTGRGFMVGPTVSVFGKHCNRGAAYIPDTFGHAVVVYEGFSEKWDFNRLNLSPFHTNQSNPGVFVENIRIANTTKGVYSVAIAAGQLFFNSFTSLDLHETKEVNIWFAQNSDHPVQFKSPATIMASSEKHEALLFASTSESAVHIWNYRHKNELEIVEQDPSVIKYISGMKVIERMGRKAELIFLTSNYQNVETGTMDFERVNFRIIRGDMDKIMEGTKAGALSACNKRRGQGEVTEVHISEDAKKLYHPPEL